MICSNCFQDVEYSYLPKHRDDCDSDDYSDIGLVEETPEHVETDRAGPTSICAVCEKRVANSHIGTHKARCEPGDHAEYGLLTGQADD